MDENKFVTSEFIDRKAAMLCVRNGILKVHAKRMTISATEILAEYGILFEADEIIEDEPHSCGGCGGCCKS